MGLFSFGAKEKNEAWEAERQRRAKRPEVCDIRLTETFGTTELDCLLKDYAPETYDNINTLLEGVSGCLEMALRISSKIDTMTSRLDEISRRLDSLERAQEIPQQER